MSHRLAEKDRNPLLGGLRLLRKLVLGIADGFVHADGKQIYEVSGLKVGLVQDAAAVPAAS